MRANRLKTAFLIVCFSVGLYFGFVSDRPMLFPSWAAPAFLVFLIVGSVAYWRVLDETAREAHKFSWYWGSSIGVALVIAVWLLDRSGLNFIQSLADAGTLGADPSEAFTNGAYTILILQTVIYAFVWGGWWLRMR
ncbi:MAG: hypothetical protein AAFR20_05955 [Pseudomonadota bacterium]